MVQIRMNTPKMRSDAALARISEMLHHMERIGRLRHGVMVPPGMDISQMKAGDRLWQPWTAEERRYIGGVRNIFAHSYRRVLGNGISESGTGLPSGAESLICVDWVSIKRPEIGNGPPKSSRNIAKG